jgi:hypothetical protein
MSSKNSWGTVVVALVGAGLVSAATTKFSKAHAPSVAPAPSESVAAPDAAPKVVVVREVATPAQAGAPAPAAPRQDREAEQARVEQDAVQEPPTDPMEAWEMKFASENRTPNREAERVEGLIHSSFTNGSLRGVRLQHVECHATLCKAEVNFADADTDRNVIRQVLMDPESEVMKDRGVIIPSRTTQPDGSIVATMYFYASGSEPTAATL